MTWINGRRGQMDRAMAYSVAAETAERTMNSDDTLQWPHADATTQRQFAAQFYRVQ